MKKQRIKTSKKEIAVIQLMLLIASIFAFSYILGSSFPVVSAQENPFSKVGFGDLVNTVNVASWFFKNPFNSKGTPLTGAEGGIIGEGATTGESALGGVTEILYAAAYAVAVYFAVQWAAKAFGASPGPARAYAAGAAAGVFVATSGLGAELASALGSSAAGGTAGGPIGIIIAVVVAIIVTLLSYKDEKAEVVVFTCSLWQPPPKEQKCEECNTGSFPCSEYQCASLGASCQIVNKGTKEQKCIWYERNDVDPPIITPWQEALKTGYSYSNNNLVSPPDRGINVSYNKASDGCIPAYTPFSLGIQIDKQAKCRADVVKRNNFSAMSIPLSGERYLRNHSITLSMPNAQDLEAENVIPIGSLGNVHKLYIRCLSSNGVESKANLEFRYCIQKGPDWNPPEIVETSIANNSPVRFGVGSVALTASIDKPGQCKWSTLDKTYGDMENAMSCATKATEYNAKMLYDCKTTLTGIKDREKNDFYFRCNGTYNGKANLKSYLFTLVGTQSLVINKVGPNETIKDSTDPVKVTLTAETSAGWNKGQAICQYSQTGEENDYIAFYNTDSYTHSQPDLGLSEGKYTYYIKCFDKGGNSANKTTNFTVEIDKSPPMVVRAFHDGSSLKIITNEEGECVYNTQEAMKCNYDFEEGVKMTDDEKEHTVGWDTYLNFYIKCKDKYENQPSFGECSIEARPFNLA